MTTAAATVTPATAHAGGISIAPGAANAPADLKPLYFLAWLLCAIFSSPSSNMQFVRHRG